MNRSATRIIFAFIILLATTTLFGQDPPQYTKNTADQTLRSNGRVNPSTLGLEIDIPLGGYPGRGISLPLSLSYSSKQWRLQEERCGSAVNGLQQTWARPEFSGDAAGGWTSSLSQPYIEYTGEWYRFQNDGEPLSTSDFLCGPETPRVGDSYMKRITVHLNGSSHELLAQDAPVPIAQGQVPDESVWNSTFYATDGSGVKYVQNSSDGTYRLYLPDGSFYDFNSTRQRKSTPDHTDLVWVRRANRLTDVNGNYIQLLLPDQGIPADVAAYPNGYWQDQLGRKFPVMMPSQNPTAPLEQSLTMPGMSQPYILKWKRLKGSSEATSALTNYSTEVLNPGAWRMHGSAPEYAALFGTGFDNACVGSSSAVYAISYGPEDKFNPVVLTDIVLPNGASYRFTYNVFGEIEQIHYPTGGREEIVHEKVAAVAELTSLYKDVNRGVVERRVYESTGDPTPDPWMYSATVSANNYRTSTLAPDGTQVDRYMHRGSPRSCGPTNPENPLYLGLMWGHDNVLAGRQYDERSFNSAGQIVSRQITRWTATTTSVFLRVSGSQKVKRNARVVTTESISYEGATGVAAASKVEYADEDVLGSPLNVVRTSEYAFKAVADGSTLAPAQPTSVPPADAPTMTDPTQSITPVRITETTYLQNDPNYVAVKSNYLDKNLVKLATSTRVKNGAETVTAAQSEIKYDDEPNYGNGYRGQPTSVRSWLDSTGSWLETKTKYDTYGNPIEVTDAKGNTTTTAYDSTYHAFPVQVTSPVPSDGTHGSNVAFVTSTAYNTTTGLPTSTTDVNNQTTQISYNDPVTGILDPLLRVRKVTEPNGRQTILEYGAGTSPTTRYMKTRSQVDESKWKEGFVWYDGLGRTFKSQTIDSNGDIFVETEYDNMSRPYKVTNPYRNGETIYWTESVFDAAGRPWKTITPDGAVVETTYSIAATGSNIGTAVTVKDQALKLRRSVTNAMGHLTRVDEPNYVGQLGAIDAPNQPTYYSYDLLNNLTQVQQPGDNNEECGPSTTTCSQTRSFQYDSLSRLKQAINPESGTIAYSYDLNSNLTTKTDARGIVTTYSYDALNRAKTRTYTNEPAGSETPDVSYYYDLVTNAKGRLIKVTNGLGDNRSTTEYTAFDILGRMTAHKQTTDNNEYTTGYKYNLAGALIEETYPSGRLVKNVLDSDGELATVQSKKNANHAFWNYANHFSYNAAGAVTSMQLGNGRWETTTFNERLQPTRIALGSIQNGTDKLKLDYEYGELLPGSGVTDFTKNNGNVSKQTITVGSVGATPGFVATQFYAYDSLNRIEIATENVKPDGQSEEPGWRQHFKFDRYGNRNFVTTGATATTTLGTCPAEVCNPSISPNNNKITSTGHSFDVAGNTTRDAQDRKFTYDTENKQTKVESLNPGTQTVTGTVGEYWYDGDGKRIKKRAYENGVPTEETIFVYDGAGILVGEYSNQAASEQDARVAYLTNDHLGSPRTNTDVNGNVTSRHDYHPFGEEVVISRRAEGLGYVLDAVRKQFTGYEHDSETELDFAQARMYGNTYGRFTSADPLGSSASSARPQSWNRYTYSYNNPLRFTDPSGMIAGDFYDLDGNRIGTDGVNDGAIYVVYDQEKANEIRKTEGNYTSAVASKITIASEAVVTAVEAAVERSNDATHAGQLKDNQKASGGFEEAGASWKTTNGKTEITAAPNGPQGDPANDGAHIALPADADGKVHVHPSGELVTTTTTGGKSGGGMTSIGGGTTTTKASFVQKPSERDVQNALPTGTNIVVAAREKKVYFYKSTGNDSGCRCVAKMSLDNFSKLGRQR